MLGLRVVDFPYDIITRVITTLITQTSMNTFPLLNYVHYKSVTLRREKDRIGILHLYSMSKCVSAYYGGFNAHVLKNIQAGLRWRMFIMLWNGIRFERCGVQIPHCTHSEHSSIHNNQLQRNFDTLHFQDSDIHRFDLRVLTQSATEKCPSSGITLLSTWAVRILTVDAGISIWIRVLVEAFWASHCCILSAHKTRAVRWVMRWVWRMTIEFS